MPYQYATEDQDYSDLASGRVIYSQAGAPAFPVRLASEMFQRARQHLQGVERLRLYDPCCGGAYHLSALGFLHGAQIKTISASDIDEKAVSLAQRNLSLLMIKGLRQREDEIRDMFTAFGKESHIEALQSVHKLQAFLAAQPQPISIRTFQANALDAESIQAGLNGEKVDLILSDVPYGLLSTWQTPANQENILHSPVWLMLEALLPYILTETVLAIAADKKQKIVHEQYQRLERFQIGKRQVTLLRKNE